MGKANTTFYHPTKDGGSALRVEMHYQTDDNPAYFRLAIAEMKDCEADFENGISCDLDFEETAKFITIFRGEAEEFDNGSPLDLGDGIFFAAKHLPDGTYAIAGCNTGTKKKIPFILKAHEALGLRLAIENSLFYLAFIKGVNP